MALKRISNSLVTRLVLFGMLLVIGGGAARYVLQARFLREDLTQLVSAQQMALADEVAREIDYKIRERRHLLDQLAATLPRALLSQPARLEAWLAERHRLNPVFNLGLLVIDTEGRVIADFPQVAGRRGASAASNPGFQRAMHGQAGVGAPLFGTFTKQPVLPMGVPLKDGRGRVEAVLVGVTALTAPDFLDRINQGRIGETGGFLLVSPVDKRFVAAGDPDLVLKPTPPPGVNLLHDRAMDGFRGSGVTVNAKGVEELSAMASVPSTGWFVVARLPTAEAFAPVRRAQDNVIRHSFTAMGVVLLVAGVFVRLTLRPLHRAATLAERMTQDEIPLKPLPVVRDDEVGHLTKAFNRLLDKLASSQAELQRMAHHDGLTGLPNRMLLDDRMHQGLARAARNGTQLAVLFLDLDGFKPINDRLGHEAGDVALVEVARRLSAVLRQSDTLARVGGDEFVMLAPDLKPNAEEGAAVLANRCIEALSHPLAIKSNLCTVGVSIGIAISDGDCTPECMLLAADKAMYAAKDQGRGRYVIAPHCDGLAAVA
ncbi:GGDEF domain-containing protein [Zoogloea sp. LCSB751]|uniref:GGDEF domain-containing protein n=1 Tax=Zoogloea sp. LCSB751 TaxID=1965277 RepID=UPI0009A48133|nr:GGDEF domain-containing protein [Zoogloea sp. LCSB751]